MSRRSKKDQAFDEQSSQPSSLAGPRILPLLALDAFLPYRVARLATGLSRGLSQRYESQFTISIPEWRVLVHLTQESKISIRDIFLRVDMDRARVTRAVQRLEARGYVSKLVNENDRRLVRLALTSAGYDLAGVLSQIARDFESELLAQLAPDSDSVFLATIESLETALAYCADG